MAPHHWLEVLLAAVAISLDNLAVALALGTRSGPPDRYRIAGIFAMFGGAAPVLGIVLGRSVSALAATWAEWIGVAALAMIGAWTIRNAVRHAGHDEPRAAPAGYAALLLLGATLSIDNLVVGFGLGLHGTEPLALGISAAGMVFVVTIGGLRAGRVGRRRWGPFAEGAAGALLILIALGIAAGVL
jgi:manganese efflux pump family protein